MEAKTTITSDGINNTVSGYLKFANFWSTINQIILNNLQNIVIIAKKANNKTNGINRGSNNRD